MFQAWFVFSFQDGIQVGFSATGASLGGIFGSGRVAWHQRQGEAVRSGRELGGGDGW